MFLYYSIVFLVSVYYVLYYYFTRTFNYWKSRNVTGPPQVAFFGNLKEFTFRRVSQNVLMQKLYNSFPKEPVVGIYRMTTPCLLIRDLDIIKHVMIKDFNLFRDRGIEFSSKGLGQNMFHADGNTWSAIRAHFSPIFSSGKLKGMFSLLNDCAEQLITYLDNMDPSNKACDISTLARKYTMSSISACAFGVNLNNFVHEVDDSLKNLDKLVFETSYAGDLDMMYPGLLKKLDISIFPTQVKVFFERLVQDIIVQRNEKPSGRGDFMDLILHLRQMGEVANVKAKGGSDSLTKITDDMIAAQAFVFYAAGFETSSTTIGFLLYQLALNPEVQDKLREEIDYVAKAHELKQGNITYESLKDMKYLEKVFSETLRMYPIVDPLQRKANHDYKIPGMDLTINKDQTVLVSILGIHHDEKYYPNPEVFDPERFDPEVAGSRHPCAYLPFGIGPRNCIGMRFGALQTKLCVAKIISRYIVEPTESTKSSIEFNPRRIVLGPTENIYLNMRRRDVSYHQE